jgi:soluble lytic murein transglycosylase-like protein
VRLKRYSLTKAAALALLGVAAPLAHADNIVLKNGQRINVTGYQLIGDKYRLQMAGGVVEVDFAEVVSIEPEDIFAAPPPPLALVNKGGYRDLVESAAKRYHVDADLISSVIATESNFNAKAVSRKNARGLMQLMPQTATLLGVRNVFDPQENIDAGTRYLGNLLQRYQNDLALALAAYNAGPERVQQYGRVPPFAETISYVRRVQKTYQKNKSSAGKSTGNKLAALDLLGRVAATSGKENTARNPGEFAAKVADATAPAPTATIP